jgi:AmmeMemoRadiSam system protein A
MSPVSVATSDLQVITTLTHNDQQALLSVARRVIRDTLAGVREPVPQVADLPPRLQEPGASFVSLRKALQLPGTVGSLDAGRAIGVDVAEHAIAVAFADPRVPVIAADEMADLTVEISVLGPLVPTRAGSYPELSQQLRPHVDGLVVGRASRRVTFLPAVWEDTRDVSDFLALLWRKAGMSPGEWPAGIRTWTYRTETFSDGPPG